MTGKTAIYVELIGAAIILASAGWELFIERPLQEMQHASDRFRIENKLDVLWLQSMVIRHKVDPDTKYVGVIDPVDVNAAGMWPLASDRSEMKTVSEQANYSSLIRGLLFLIGSVLLITARRHELTNKKDRTAV
jgi:hypothetical protein